MTFIGQEALPGLRCPGSGCGRRLELTGEGFWNRGGSAIGSESEATSR
jgi:hypothetical protein